MYEYVISKNTNIKGLYNVTGLSGETDVWFLYLPNDKKLHKTARWQEVIYIEFNKEDDVIHSVLGRLSCRNGAIVGINNSNARVFYYFSLIKAIEYSVYIKTFCTRMYDICPCH
jgi:hypothetical protein